VDQEKTIPVVNHREDAESRLPVLHGDRVSRPERTRSKNTAPTVVGRAPPGLNSCSLGSADASCPPSEAADARPSVASIA
jgi:hypothetical protein